MADAMTANNPLNQRSDIIVAVGVIGIIMMLIIPLPSVLLDVLMALNLVLALLIILIVLYTRRALEFTVFPTLLLVSTVFSLALNVSSTRLILNDGENFSGAIVRAFAKFVVGSEGQSGIVVGTIIFIIIIAVQFVVITKGATRVSEVAARFTLDSLPGKQMAIEAEYNSGAITEAEATRKKNELQTEVDFYGAMDGASKFVSGNVMIGLLITAINIIGGLIVGITIHGEAMEMAVDTYFRLAIGDGLVSQFPALLISTATGLIVTRAISDGTFGQDMTKQFSAQSRIYWIAGGFLGVLALVPGFPWYVLLPMGGLSMFMAFRLQQKEAAQVEAESKGQEKAPEAERPSELSPIAPLDPLSLELGYGLIPLVDKDKGAELLDRVTRIRKETALELGLVVPPIRIIDNMRLEPSQYAIKIKGVEVGRGLIRMGMYMCINPGVVSEEIEGETTRDPAFGLPAKWIKEDQREEAERMGYTVVDAPSIIATHLTEIIKAHGAEILGRKETHSIIDALKQEYPTVVEEVQKNLSVGEIQKVLQGLLVEQVSIRNMVTILETMADFSLVTKDITFLREKVRQALGRQICLQLIDEENTIHVLTVAPQLEQMIIESKVDTAAGVIAAMEPDMQRQWITASLNNVRKMQELGFIPVILTSEPARPLVKSSINREMPDVSVISVPEISGDIKIESIGEINLNG